MFSTTDLFLSPCFWFFPPSAASQSVIILFHLTSINLFCSKPPCWPPTFCPLALTINTNNHIQDLVPNNIRHAERLLSEVSSGILQHDMGKNSVGKTEKEKKFSLDWFFCWHLQQIKKEKKKVLTLWYRKGASVRGNKFLLCMQNRICIRHLLSFSISSLYSTHLSPPPSHSNCIFHQFPIERQLQEVKRHSYVRLQHEKNQR